MSGNAPKPTTAQIIGGTYNVAPDLLQDGQADSLQLDSAGNLKVAVSGGAGTTNVNIADINGVPPALINPLPVELSDGAAAVGTPGNPLSVNVIAGGGSNASVGVNGASAPSSATEIGTIDSSGKLQGASSANPVPVSIQGASSTGGSVKTIDGTPGTQFIFQEILMELRAIRKILMIVYEESGQGNLAPDLIDDVNTPTQVDY